MSAVSQVTFTLKCVLCGKVEKQPAEQISHDDLGPACSKCYGPMTLLKVERVGK